MKRLLTLALIAASTLTYGQHSQTRKIASPNGIAVSRSIQAKYIVSNRNEVVVEVENQDHLDKLETVVKGGTLHIRYKSNVNIRTQKPNRVTVYSTAKLQQINVSSSASLHIESEIKVPQILVTVNSSGKLLASTIIAEHATIDLSSSGRFDAHITTSKLTIDGSSSAKLVLAGSANEADLDISSSANIDLAALKLKRATVDASSSSKATVQVSENLTADVSSSAKVYYIGKPQNLTVNKSSSGQVLQK